MHELLSQSSSGKATTSSESPEKDSGNPSDAPAHKRTRSAIAKVPLSRFFNLPWNLAKETKKTQDLEGSKRRRLRSSGPLDDPEQVTTSIGAPAKPQRTPTASHPLAGQIRRPRDSSTSSESSDASKISDVPTNKG